ncbi:hypothetical protein AAIH69_13640 [Paenibacillus sp. MABNS29]|jgi:hypothetical protein|uniref:hypothetical protein n=1 Tax=Paenibacillus sp. MABNS29 TaxID=3142627 RepID=UPI003D28D5C6
MVDSYMTDVAKEIVMALILDVAIPTVIAAVLIKGIFKHWDILFKVGVPAVGGIGALYFIFYDLPRITIHYF